MAFLHGCAGFANSETPWGLTLLHLDGANGDTAIVEESGKPFARVGTPAITTADSKFGGASLDFLTSGNNRYSISNGAYSNDLMPGLGPLTMECFFKFYEATGFTLQGLVGIGAIGVALNMVRGGGTYGSKDCICVTTHNLGGTFLDSGVPITDSEWHHAAVCRDVDGAWSLWVDGVLRATSTFVFNISSPLGAMVLGNEMPVVNGYHFRGLLDEVRYIKGKAMYSGSTITVPTAPFPFARP